MPFDSIIFRNIASPRLILMSNTLRLLKVRQQREVRHAELENRCTGTGSRQACGYDADHRGSSRTQKWKALAELLGEYILKEQKQQRGRCHSI